MKIATIPIKIKISFTEDLKKLICVILIFSLSLALISCNDTIKNEAEVIGESSSVSNSESDSSGSIEVSDEDTSSMESISESQNSNGSSQSSDSSDNSSQGEAKPTLNPTKSPTGNPTINPTSTPNVNREFGEKNSDGTRTYYVRTNTGNDNNPGTKAKPFKTIAEAVLNMSAGDTTLIGNGTYYENIFPPNGQKGKPIKISSIPGEKPTITTAVQYKGTWQKYKGNIYVADFSEIDNNMDIDFPQLFLNGDSMVEARYPNMGSSMSKIMDYNRAITQAGTNDTTIVMKDEIQGNLTDARVVVWPGDNGLSAWVAFTTTVRIHNGKTLRLRDKLDTKETVIGSNAYSPVPGNVYYLTGSLVLLDAPGEYYYDSIARKMYFYTPKGDNPTNYDISVRGVSSTAVYAENSEYIHISGLTIYGGGLNFKNSNNSIIENNKVMYAEHFYGNGYASYARQTRMVVEGNNNIIRNNSFGPTAGNGITLGGDNNLFTNNIVHDSNYAGNDFAAIFVKRSSGLEISYNTIRDSARAHIFFDINQTFGKNVVKNNHFKDHSTLNSDCGAFYTWSSNGGGTVIKNNFVEVGNKNNNGNMMKLRVGLYIDNYSSNYIVHHNIVKGGHAGLQTNLPNPNTIFANNTVIGSDYGYGIFSVPKDNAEGKDTGFYNNLFVDLKNYDISYYGTEKGVFKSYQGNLQDGKVPVPYNPLETIQSSNNLRGQVDSTYRPVSGSVAINGGITVPGITDGFTGSAPSIGALEFGETLFRYGADFS